MKSFLRIVMAALTVVLVLIPTAAYADTNGKWYYGRNSAGANAAKARPILVSGGDADLKVKLQDTKADGSCARARVGWIKSNGTVTYSGVVSECDGVVVTKSFGGPDRGQTVSVELYLWSGPKSAAKWVGKPFCNGARIKNNACDIYFWSL